MLCCYPMTPRLPQFVHPATPAIVAGLTFLLAFRFGPWLLWVSLIFAAMTLTALAESVLRHIRRPISFITVRFICALRQARADLTAILPPGFPGIIRQARP